jgi:adenylate cyclase
MLINYAIAPENDGDATSFDTVSFVDTLRGEVDPAIFHDKIILIGATASALGDTFWTPAGQMMNGVEIHASAIDTILSADFLRPASSALTIALIMVLSILCSLIVLRFRVLWATLLAIFICVIYLIAAFSLFDTGTMLNMVYPPLSILGVFVGVNLFNIASERAEKRAITQIFGRYISSPVVTGGHQQEATIVFADMREFTSISENMQPDDLVGVLNTYLSAVINTVLEYNGMVNKFGGDSIMAIWNVPTPCEGHALLAIKAAIEIQNQVKELQKSNPLLPKIEFGIGINTGAVLAGNMGSEARLEYSVVGDAVNIAARLTSLAEGGKIWIGSNTYEQTKDHITADPLEPLTVKGKREPLQVYEILNNSEESYI